MTKPKAEGAMAAKKVAIVGVPMDLGANRRGVDMGPSAIRITQVADAIRRLGIDVVDVGDIDVHIPEEISLGDSKMRFIREIHRVCNELHNSLTKVMLDGRTPITLGGDHSIAIGSIKAASGLCAANRKRLGLIWADAHGDMNTPLTTLTGNVHGMPLSHVLGLWSDGDFQCDSTSRVSSTNSCLLGVRDLDEREKKLIKDSGIHVYTMKEIDRYGIAQVMQEVIRITTTETAGIHLSFDVDVLDPSIAPGVGTPKKGGLDYREAHFLMESIADSEKLISLDMVEVNPILDVRNATAELASELILSALGKSIF